MSRTSGSRKAKCPLLSPVNATRASPARVPLLSWTDAAREGIAAAFVVKNCASLVFHVLRGPTQGRGQRGAPQLAAGRVDLRSLALANFDADALCFERPGEGRQRLGCRPAVSEAFDVIKRNDVDVSPPSPEQICQFPAVAHIVIDSRQQHIFVGD